MKESLDKLVAAQLKYYKEQPMRMVSDFNREHELVGEYNGRQILEMLQNADDEQADAVLIRLDEDNGVLTIANQGQPFTVAGFESLMLANLSSKTKVRYIGSKGLGFRSIINWARQVTIDSGTVSATFSEAIAGRTFERLFDARERARIRSERNLSARAVPVAFLAVPEFGDRTRHGWTTEISIHYRPEYLVGIREQLASLQPECLLFLKHIGTITIVQNGEECRIQRSLAGDTVRIGDDIWTIRSDEAPLPAEYQNADKAEKEWYSLKLALSDGLQKGAQTLYSFFPTKVNIDFPMVIHGTFDLDSSRNQLVQSSRNKFLLAKLVDLIVDTARLLREHDDDPWIQVRLLRHQDSNPVLKELQFYRHIDQSVRELEIFPCVDGRYRRASAVYYLGEAFSRLVLLAGCGTEFPGLAHPGEENLLHLDQYHRVSQVTGFDAAINRLSASLLHHGMEHRATLISILCNEPEAAGCHSLLVNDRNELIDSATDAYTPLTAGADSFVIPSFVNIDFMSQRLYGQLVERLGVDAGEKARDIQRKLKSITTIHSYEPAQVIRSIIRSANAAIGRPGTHAADTIGEMVSALLANFSALGDPAALPSDVSVRLLNANLEVVDARELFLSRGYPTGTHTERIFAKVYQASQFLASPPAFGPTVSTADPAVQERLFLWLGVNRYVRYSPVKSGPLLRGYEEHVFSVVERPASYRDANIQCLAVHEPDLDRMLGGGMNREQLIEWLIRDPEARSRLEPDNPDIFHYSKVNERAGTAYHSLQCKPSYLHFRLRKAAWFDGFVLDRDLPVVDLVNPFSFDFTMPGLVGTGAGRRGIETVMSRLGAKDRFEELPLGAVAEILRRLPKADPLGERAQRIYRLARLHYDEHGQPLPRDVPLFAHMGRQGAYHPQAQVYYSDNIRLPRVIVGRYPILDYPRRGGGAKVPAFFGINNLNDIPIQVDGRVPLPALTEALASMLREKLPFILAYRIHGMQSNRKAESARLARLSIVLCADITCRVGGEAFPLAVNDYVNDVGKFLIKVDPSTSLHDLTRDPQFCDTFADIIGSIFAVSEHRAEIRGVFKDPLCEVQHLATSELGEATVREARQLLGIADPAMAFWAAVWSVRHGGALQDFQPGDIGVLLDRLRELDVDPSRLEFEQISAPENISIALAILRTLDVPVDAFNSVALYGLDLTELHRKKLADKQYQHFGAFTYALWRHLDDQDWTARGRFLGMVAEYEHRGWIDEVATHHREDPDLDYDALVRARIGARFEHLALAGEQDHEIAYRRQSVAFSPDELASLPAEARSLLYFEGGLEQLRERAAAQRAPPQPRPGGAPLPRELPAHNATPVAAPSTFTPGARPGGSHKHSPARDIENRASGERAEQVVIASLIAAYGEKYVEHVAHRHDGAGYDIRYSPDKGASWRYAEVKRYTQNCIHLSGNEYAFAIANRDAYELFLVSASDEIHCLHGIDFNDRDQFSVKANEYIVSFKLQYTDASHERGPEDKAGAAQQADPEEEAIVG